MIRSMPNKEEVRNYFIKNIVKKQGVLDPEGKYANPLNGRPYSQEYVDMAFKISPKWATEMKTYLNRNDFFKQVVDCNIIIAKAPTGTGKNVVIPRLAMHIYGYSKRVFLINAQVAQCLSSATSAVSLNDTKLGEGVGHVYPIGSKPEDDEDDVEDPFDNVEINSGKAYNMRTKLLFASDNWLQAYIKGHPDLLDEREDAGCVILDEFHKRTIGQDFLFALLCDLARRRPEFRIILMSATLNPTPIIQYAEKVGLRVGIWDVPGSTTFPIDHHYLDVKVGSERGFENKLEAKVMEVLEAVPTGNILVFLPSMGPIVQKIEKLLAAAPTKFPLRPIVIKFEGKTQKENKEYIEGSADFNKLKRPDDTGPDYGRMLILATPIAQEGITFSNLTAVIDTGVSNAVFYSPIYYATIQGYKWVARSDMTQRCGRTGRTEAGTCFHIYSKSQFDEQLEEPEPQILQTDMTGNYLDIITHPNYGNFRKADEFFSKMMTPPTAASKEKAVKNLLGHNLLALTGYPTALGYLVNRTKKFDYRYCKMLVAGLYFSSTEVDYLTPIKRIVAIMQVLDLKSGIFDLFEDLPSKTHDSYAEKEARRHALLASFTIPDSDHITALNIYQQSLDPEIFLEDPRTGRNIKQKDRRNWAKAYMLNYYRLTEIDEMVKEIDTKFLTPHHDEILNLDILNVKGGKYQTGGTRKRYKQFMIGGGDKELMLKFMASINFQGFKHPTITPLPNYVDNLLACLFYGYVNNLGILENPEKSKAYLIKYSSTNLGKPTNSVITNSMPYMIMYDGFKLRYKQESDVGDLTMVSVCPQLVIECFGLKFSHLLKSLQ